MQLRSVATLGLFPAIPNCSTALCCWPNGVAVVVAAVAADVGVEEVAAAWGGVAPVVGAAAWAAAWEEALVAAAEAWAVAWAVALVAAAEAWEVACPAGVEGRASVVVAGPVPGARSVVVCPEAAESPAAEFPGAACRVADSVLRASPAHAAGLPVPHAPQPPALVAVRPEESPGGAGLPQDVLPNWAAPLQQVPGPLAEASTHLLAAPLPRSPRAPVSAHDLDLPNRVGAKSVAVRPVAHAPGSGLLQQHAIPPRRVPEHPPAMVDAPPLGSPDALARELTELQDALETPARPAKGARVPVWSVERHPDLDGERPVPTPDSRMADNLVPDEIPAEDP